MTLSLAEEECARRRGSATSSADTVSPRSNTSDTPDPTARNRTRPAATTPSILDKRSPNAAGDGGNLAARRGGGSDPATEDGGSGPATEGGGSGPATEDEDQQAPTTTGVEDRLPTPTPGHQLSPGGAPSSLPTTRTHDTILQDDGPTTSQLIPGPGAFTFNGAAKFVTSSTINYFETIPGGECWTQMVRTYLELEHLSIPKGVRPPSFFTRSFALMTWTQSPLRLPTDSRPDEIGTWLATRSYNAEHIPHVPDVDTYHKRWLAWWKVCQPAWRKTNGWPFSKEETDVGWGKLKARGQNGIFIVVMSTTWWASSIESPEDRRAFEEAVDDLRWVLEQLLRLHSTSNAPDPPPPPAGPEILPSNAPWLVRPPGKRQSKPSYKVSGRS